MATVPLSPGLRMALSKPRWVMCFMNVGEGEFWKIAGCDHSLHPLDGFRTSVGSAAFVRDSSPLHRMIAVFVFG
jgi:hypothetical protein